jgi:hypothetical protein
MRHHNLALQREQADRVAYVETYAKQSIARERSERDAALQARKHKRLLKQKAAAQASGTSFEGQHATTPERGRPGGPVHPLAAEVCFVLVHASCPFSLPVLQCSGRTCLVHIGTMLLALCDSARVYIMLAAPFMYSRVPTSCPVQSQAVSRVSTGSDVTRSQLPASTITGACLCHLCHRHHLDTPSRSRQSCVACSSFSLLTARACICSRTPIHGGPL